MLDFLLADRNAPYLILMLLLLSITFLELLGTLIGMSISSSLDNIDIDIPEGIFTTTFGWLHFGKLPMLIWFVVILTSFSVSGILANYLAQAFIGKLLPFIISLPIAIGTGVTLTRIFGNALIKILPQHETSALTMDSFVGSVVTITIGTARIGSPAEACFTDSFRQKHYLMVEPLDEGEVFTQNQKIVLIQKESGYWKGALFDSLINN